MLKLLPICGKEAQGAGSYTRHRLEVMRHVVDEVLETYPGNSPSTGSDEHAYHVHPVVTNFEAALTGIALNRRR